MKKKLNLFLLLFTHLSSFIYAEIIEVAHFSKLADYVDEDCLILLDIDDTLLIPVQTLGTDVWFQYQLNKHKQAGLSSIDALDKSLAEWEAIRHITKVQLVEENTDKLVASIQRQGFTVMGLTTQGLALATRTVKQLEALHIDLSKTSPSADDIYFMNGQGVLYRDGILFTSGTNKGKALAQLFNLIDYHPKRVVFINDKDTHLKDVEIALENEGISFLGLRYAYSDKRVALFRKEIAEIQFRASSFDRILSDMEAEELLK